MPVPLTESTAKWNLAGFEVHPSEAGCSPCQRRSPCCLTSRNPRLISQRSTMLLLAGLAFLGIALHHVHWSTGSTNWFIHLGFGSVSAEAQGAMGLWNGTLDLHPCHPCIRLTQDQLHTPQRGSVISSSPMCGSLSSRWFTSSTTPCSPVYSPIANGRHTERTVRRYEYPHLSACKEVPISCPCHGDMDSLK